MKKIVCLVLLAISMLQSKAQTSRVEIEAKQVSENYNIIPIGKEGVIMFYESKERAKGGNKIWVFSKYDNNFKEVWTKEYPVDKSVDFVDYDSDAQNLYLFLGEPRMQGSTGTTSHQGEVNIITMDYKAGTFKTFTNKIPMKAEVKYFNVINNHAVLTGVTLPGTSDACLQMLLTCTCVPWITQYTVFHFQPVVFNFNLGSTTSSVVKNKDYKGNTYILGAEENPKNNTIDLVYKNKAKYNTPSEIIVKNYNSDGKETGNIKLKGDDKNEMVSARISNISASEQILIGTFRKAGKLKKYFNPASNKAMGNGDDSEGMYFSKIVDGKQKFIKYYSFSDFSENFYRFTYNGALTEKKKEKAMKAAKAKGPSYRLLVHDVIQQNNQYIMIAEAYYPVYHTVCYYNGKTTTCYQVFDGFQYSHAVLAGFDKEGTKLWDNTFELYGSLTFKLKEKVRVLTADDQIVLVYPNVTSIASKIISGSKVIEGKTNTKIDTGFDKDKVKQSSEGAIEYWYDNYFISYGYQKIKSDEEAKNAGKDKKRRVYYFNKIAYQ